MMPNHKFINEENPVTSVGRMGAVVLLVILLYGWVEKRDLDVEQLTRCPAPGPGQELIGRGHFEIDGEPGELQCTYTTAPAYKHVAMVE